MKTTPLSTSELNHHMKGIHQWAKQGEAICRTFKFADFSKALNFVNQVGSKAEEANHHPDIDIRYNKVTLTLTTHDQGGLTVKDFALARECDDISNQFFTS